MERTVPISEARTHLTPLLEEAREHEVYLIKHSKPVGVLLDAEKYERLLDHIEDLEDRLAMHEREGDTISLDEAHGTLAST